MQILPKLSTKCLQYATSIYRICSVFLTLEFLVEKNMSLLMSHFSYIGSIRYAKAGCRV